MEFVQAIDKELTRMTPVELRREKAAHKYEHNKLRRATETLERRIQWLSENLQFVDMEEKKAQYHRGEITLKQFQSFMGTQSTRIRQYRATEDKREYVNKLYVHEEAVIRLIDELLEEKQSKPNNPGYRYYVDPRKRAGWYNPRADWKRTHPHVRPPKRLKKHGDKWDAIDSSNQKVARLMVKMQAMPKWDYERLKFIARDRGYSTELSIAAAISDAIGISISSAKSVLKSGRMPWSYILTIGALFEMTPLEFCDVFLNGYFEEAVDGKWVASQEYADLMKQTETLAQNECNEEKEEPSC